MIFPRHNGEDHGAAMPGMTGGTTTGAAAAEGHGHSDGMMMMMSVFQTERATPLYSMRWTPASTAGYAGTVIFLIALAMLFRGLLAAKAWQEARWLDAEMNRRYVVVNGKLPMSERLSRDSFAKKVTLTENGVEEDVMVVRKHGNITRPWRISVDPIRAVIDTIIAGVGYLLMLAVMTMNVGYFLAILGGTFLGSLAVGRFATHGEH